MLFIYTQPQLQNKPYIHDVETEFYYNISNVNTLYSDKKSTDILTKIEGMTNRNGILIDGKFGTVSLLDISTGCKVLLLAVSKGSSNIINTDEAGNNIVRLLFEYAKNQDIHILTHRVINDIPDDYCANIEGEICYGEDISCVLAEKLGKEIY